MTPPEAESTTGLVTPSAGAHAAGTPPTDPPFNLRATVVSVTVGTTLEYVDFALFGLATGLVFRPVFFPNSSPALAMLYLFATYSVGFLARPAGSLFFGWLGDRIGRKRIMIITMIMMGIATTSIGFLPGYAAAGYVGPVLMIALRLCQGFAAGAELSGGAIMLTESAAASRRGLVASLIALGSNGGVLVASGAWMLVNLLPRAEVVAWGWRIPFLCSILIAAAALFLRRKMAESPVFSQVQTSADVVTARVQAAASAPTNTSGKKAFISLLGLRIAENGPSYLAQVFIVNYVATYLRMKGTIPTDAVFIGALLGFAAAPIIGHLTDRYGRRIVYRTLCGVLIIFPFLGYALMDTRSDTIVFAVIVAGFVLASVGMFAAQAAFAAELFGMRSRFRKMALAKEVGSVLSGGIAPLAAAALLAAVGHWWIVASYSAVMSAIGFVTTFFTPETAGRDLRDPEDAM